MEPTTEEQDSPRLIASDKLGYATDAFCDALDSGDEAAIEAASNELDAAQAAFQDACEATRTEGQEAIDTAAAIFALAPEAVAEMAEKVKAVGGHLDAVNAPPYIPGNRAGRRAQGWRGQYRTGSLSQRAKAA